jgi:hypothetical protein
LKTLKTIPLVAILLSILPSLTQAQNTLSIQVLTTGESNVIRRDIGRTTFGTGIEAGRSEMGWAMKPIINESDIAESKENILLTADTFKWLQLGSFRFPNGNSSFQYLWSNPSWEQSEAAKNDEYSRFMRWEDIKTYTGNIGRNLNMERVFQANTVLTLNSEGTPYTVYIDTNAPLRGGNSSLKPELNYDNLRKAANYTAEWVEKDACETKFWEIGNEDWSRLFPSDYAIIFSSFQDKMLEKCADIKFLAQGLEQDVPIFESFNKPDDWLNALVEKLGAKKNSVYAYSIHDYIEAPPYVDMKLTDELRKLRRKMQTEDMFAAVDMQTGTDLDKIKKLLKDKGLNWKIWMTEFNVSQTEYSSQGQKCVLINKKPSIPNVNSCTETLQDLGHGLVIADWVGKLLEQNVERLFILDLGQSDEYGMVDFGKTDDNSKSKVPQVSVPGHVYSMFSKNFGQTMIQSKVLPQNPLLNFSRGMGEIKYNKLGVYSSISSNEQELRMMVVNRDLENNAFVNIDTQAVPGRRQLANGQYCIRTLTSDKINKSNVNQGDKDKVNWTAPQYKNQTAAAGISAQELPPASVSLFVIPLKQKNSQMATNTEAVDCGDDVKTAVILDGFEYPKLSKNNFSYHQVGTAWKFSGSTGSGVQRTGSAFGARETPQGMQTAFLQGGDAHISISTGVLEAGIHNISFYAARRATDSAANPVQVKIDGYLIGGKIAPINADFIRYTTGNFKLDTNGPHTLEIVSTNGAPGDFSTFIDAVTVHKLRGLN